MRLSDDPAIDAGNRSLEAHYPTPAKMFAGAASVNGSVDCLIAASMPLKMDVKNGTSIKDTETGVLACGSDSSMETLPIHAVI